MTFPDLNDANRSQAIQRLAAELASPEMLAKLKEDDPSNLYLDPSHMSEFISAIEKEIWTNHRDNYNKYARERVLVLMNKSNQQLKSALLHGDLSVEDFVSKTPVELENPETRKRILEAQSWKMKA